MDTPAPLDRDALPALLDRMLRTEARLRPAVIKPGQCSAPFAPPLPPYIETDAGLATC